MNFETKIGNDVVQVFNSKKAVGDDYSVIVPYRYSKGREDSIERIELLGQRIREETDQSIIIVDSGSEKRRAEEVKDVCFRIGATYVYLDTTGEMFSAGKARDIGAIVSQSECLFFQDIDLLSYKGFYSDLKDDVASLREEPTDVRVFPCFYLSENESNAFKKTCPSAVRDIYYDKYLEGDSGLINSAIFSSAMLVSKAHFLSIGGHDPDFFGHGFEDFELMNRLANIDNRFSRPTDYYHDGRTWSPVKYEGFRAYFRCYGEKALAAKRYLVHIYHDSVDLPLDFVKQNKKNKALLEKKMKDFDRTRVCPTALPDLSKGRTLCLGSPYSAFYKSINYALPYFGKLDFVDEHQFEDGSACLDYVNKHGLDRVLMPNPYGNEKRLSLYFYLKRAEVDVVVSDRGGLNGSHFFDRGFNADSPSYDVSLWDNALSEEELVAVESYISDEKSNERALEKQPDRESSNATLQKLKIPQGKKVLFVPLQRPNDTVVKYFSGSLGGMPGFFELLSEVADRLPPDWVVLCKKHPLEDVVDVQMKQNIYLVGDECHFKDLVNLSSAMLLINSGVGLYGLMYEKPVMVAGEAYYSHPGLVTRVKSANDVLNELDVLRKPDEEKVKRFISYLLNCVYSFGVTFSSISQDSSGKRINVARYVDFESLRILGEHVFSKPFRDVPIYTLKSPIFDRYRYWLTSVKGKENSTPKARATSAPVQAKSSTSAVVKGKDLQTFPQNNKTFKRKLRKLIRDPKLFFEDRAKKRALN